MRHTFYSRKGEPITVLEMAEAMERDKVVVQETLPNGRWISTVWLGLDHHYGNGPPLIFETMVFDREGEWTDLDQRRYSTEEQARAGHAEMVAKWSQSEAE